MATLTSRRAPEGPIASITETEMETTIETATHGPGPFYKLVRQPSGQLMIRCQDRDHARTVAFVDSRQQWKRFVYALDRGADEVAAVHALDA